MDGIRSKSGRTFLEKSQSSRPGESFHPGGSAKGDPPCCSRTIGSAYNGPAHGRTYRSHCSEVGTPGERDLYRERGQYHHGQSKVCVTCPSNGRCCEAG